MPWNVRQVEPAPSGSNYVQVFDSLSVVGGVYPTQLNYPNTCNAIDQAVQAQISGTDISVAQTAAILTDATPVNSVSITLPQNTVAGSLLLLSVSFSAGTYVAGSGVSVTDDQGGTWSFIAGGIPPFQPSFLQLWALRYSSGATYTITFHFGGTYQIFDVNLTVTEYVSADAFTLSADFESGPVFGTGTPINLSTSLPTTSLLYLVTQATMPCGAIPPDGGMTLTGGGEAPVPPYSPTPTPPPLPLQPPTVTRINDRTLPVYSLNIPMSNCEEKDPCRQRYPLL